MTATAEAGEPRQRWAIVEIDIFQLDELDLLPDEDFLEQGTRNSEISDGEFFQGLEEATTLEERTKWFRDRLGMFQHTWEESINHLGNCAHMGEIPAEAITRVSLFDPESNDYVGMAASDPCITLMNYLICKQKYIDLTAWFFKDISVDQMMGNMWEIVALGEEQKQSIRDDLNRAEGLEIIKQESRSIRVPHGGFFSEKLDVEV
jgi:hypothetical protein